MDHMHGAMGGDADSCKVSMLWNWYTIDACFLSSSWHVRNRAMFAASCIGAMLLVVVVEFLRRMGKEYDALIVRQARRRFAQQYAGVKNLDAPVAVFRATLLQQLARAVIHALTFGGAYIVMLLAMYFNGYIILSIFIGAGLGSFCATGSSSPSTSTRDAAVTASRPPRALRRPASAAAETCCWEQNRWGFGGRDTNVTSVQKRQYPRPA